MFKNSFSMFLKTCFKPVHLSWFNRLDSKPGFVNYLYKVVQVTLNAVKKQVLNQFQQQVFKLVSSTNLLKYLVKNEEHETLMKYLLLAFIITL